MKSILIIFLSINLYASNSQRLFNSMPSLSERTFDLVKKSDGQSFSIIERTSEDNTALCRKIYSDVVCYRKITDNSQEVYNSLSSEIWKRISRYPGPGYLEKEFRDGFCLKIIPSGNAADDIYECYFRL